MTTCFPDSARRLVLALVAASAFGGLGACASTQALHAAQPAGNGLALVHFIRKKYPPYIHELRVGVDGQPAGTLANNDILAVNMSPGLHRVTLEVTDGKPFFFNVPVDRAEDMYVLLSGDVTRGSSSVQPGYGYVLQLDWTLRAQPVSRADAVLVAKELGKPLD